ncbi:CoA ester lyase [Chloroflexi bacterium TSY]|nr:CoA ester lyase [Chloroflexi bacterium TSY]
MPDHSRPLLLIRKSLLFMPGDSRRKIEKATQLPVDSVIMDLEDGVALSRKPEARETIDQALCKLDFGPRERLVRVNPVESEFQRADLDAVSGARPDGLVVPKVEQPIHLMDVDDYLTSVERENEWPILSIRLLAVIETALGVLNLREIANSTPRLDALMFGAEDLAGDIGAIRTADGWEVFYARSAVVTTAAAFGLQAIDTVFTSIHDEAGLEADCTFVQKMGYMGKMAIHPNQLAVINRVFSPSQDEIEQAQQLIDLFNQHQEAGTGAFELDGKMVDMPMVRAAYRVLARAGRG